MTILNNALKAIIQHPAMRTAATFRGATIYGHFNDETLVIDGVRTRVVTYELVSADLDQDPAVNETITIGTTTYKIADTEPGQYGNMVLILMKNT